VDSSSAAVSLALLPLSVASSASQCLLIVELHRQNENSQSPEISSLFKFNIAYTFFFFKISRKSGIMQKSYECPNENPNAQIITTINSEHTGISLLENNLYPPSSTWYFF